MKRNLSRIAVLMLTLVMMLTSVMAVYAETEGGVINDEGVTADIETSADEATNDNDVTDPGEEPQVTQYTVTWMNGEVVLDTSEVAEGTVPVFLGDEPVREEDDEYTYSFAGWAESDGGSVLDMLPAATGDVTYYAVFTQSEKPEPPEPVTYTVTFTDGNGKNLKTEQVASDEAATAPAAPKRNGYHFNGWDKAFSKVTSDLTVNAKWHQNHSYGGWTVTVKPTYFKTGKKVRKCSCGKSETQTVAKLTAKNKWISEGGKLYYFGSNGSPVKGWVKMKPNKSKTIKWCYFAQNGVYTKSISKNTKKKWITAGGYKFYFTKKKKPAGKGFNTINKKLYHMNSFGAVMYGTFKASDGNTYTTNKNGSISGLAYYKVKYKTFVLVDISEQTIWFYKNGKQILKSDVVTGHRGVHNTPTGVYKVRSKARNINLVGPTWNSHVKYWMAFIGSSYGLHDASWRSSAQFSNHKTYISNGSHGCVNLRPSFAPKLYNNVKKGTTVIIQK